MNVKSTLGACYKSHHFCPECAAHLQIKSEPTEETSAERLVAVLEAVIDEAVSERLEEDVDA